MIAVRHLVQQQHYEIPHKGCLHPLPCSCWFTSHVFSCIKARASRLSFTPAEQCYSAVRLHEMILAGYRPESASLPQIIADDMVSLLLY